MNKLAMDNGPLVSVVVPTYNRAGTVVKAIDSILHQSYSRLEVVVVDDGSTDNTIQVLKEAQSKDARLLYCGNTGGKGCAGARNTGISMATGEYVAFLDDDDEYGPELEIFLGNPGVDVVVSGVPAGWCSEGNQGIGWVRLEFHPNLVFTACFIMCKRAVLEQARLRCNYMEWRDFAFQVYEKGFVVFLSSERLVRNNDSAASLSKNKERLFVMPRPTMNVLWAGRVMKSLSAILPIVTRTGAATV
jgi:glycosyltransferase involved in cell wall biosynthesis